MRTGTRHSITRALALAVAALCLVGFGGPLVERTREGNALLAEGDFDGALRAYTDAQLEDPENPLLQYNIGNVKYRQGKFKEAIESYRQAIRDEDVEVQRNAHYNIGNCLLAQGDLANAILEYKSALEIDPDDENAKYNLEYARKKIKEQQEQQQSEKNKQQQGDSSQQKQQQGQQQGQQGQDQSQQPEGEQDAQKQAATGEQPETPGDEKQDTAAAGAEPGDQPGEEQGAKPDEEDSAGAREGQPLPDGALTEAQAQAILNALEDSEKEAQEELLRQKSGQKDRNKDW